MLRARTDRASGFTLIELGIVLGVSAILAAALLPDFIEQMRNKMAEKAALDVSHVHDAAKWFFVESTVPTTPELATWPGQSAPDSCTTPLAPKDVLTLDTKPYLRAQAFQSPWKEPYHVTLSGTGAACSLVVTTALPSQVQRVFTAFLPIADCNSPTASPCPPLPGPVPPGFAVCCSRIPKPGSEASIKQATDPLKKNPCDPGKFVTGFTADLKPICGSPPPPPPPPPPPGGGGGGGKK